VLVLLIINFKPSGLLGEWELTPRNVKESVLKLVGGVKKLIAKLGSKKEVQ